MSMKYAFCLIFEFTTHKGLKIIPSDREEQERSVKRVGKKITVFSKFVTSTFSGEEKRSLERARFLQHCSFHKSSHAVKPLERAKIKKRNNKNNSNKVENLVIPYIKY